MRRRQRLDLAALRRAKAAYKKTEDSYKRSRGAKRKALKTALASAKAALDSATSVSDVSRDLLKDTVAEHQKATALVTLLAERSKTTRLKLLAEVRRLKRVEQKERERREALRRSILQKERVKRLPAGTEEEIDPPSPRRYTPEDARRVAELVEDWMRRWIVPCARKNMGMGHVYRYCDSNDVDGQVRIELPLVLDLPIDHDDDDPVPPDAEYVYVEPMVVTKDLNSCLQGNAEDVDLQYRFETYYQVGWKIVWPGGKKIDSDGDIVKPLAMKHSEGQAVQTRFVASNWIHGDFPTALGLAPTLLFREDDRGYLQVNKDAGQPVSIEFFMNFHWDPRDGRPPRISEDMEIWQDIIEPAEA